jgi:hypothetical protein
MALQQSRSDESHNQNKSRPPQPQEGRPSPGLKKYGHFLLNKFPRPIRNLSGHLSRKKPNKIPRSHTVIVP